MPEAPAWEQLRTRFAGCFSRLILSEWTLTAQVASLLEASLVAPAGLKSTNVVYVLGAAASVLMVAIGPNVLLFVKKGGGQQVREVRPQHLGKERALHTGPNGEALIDSASSSLLWESSFERTCPRLGNSRAAGLGIGAGSHRPASPRDPGLIFGGISRESPSRTLPVRLLSPQNANALLCGNQ